MVEVKAIYWRAMYLMYCERVIKTFQLRLQGMYMYKTHTDYRETKTEMRGFVILRSAHKASGSNTAKMYIMLIQRRMVEIFAVKLMASIHLIRQLEPSIFYQH
jgi:hypothetical protein